MKQLKKATEHFKFAYFSTINSIFQINNIPHTNKKDETITVENSNISEASFGDDDDDDESYDMEAVTVPVTICLTIMVG